MESLSFRAQRGRLGLAMLRASALGVLLLAALLFWPGWVNKVLAGLGLLGVIFEVLELFGRWIRPEVLMVDHRGVGFFQFAGFIRKPLFWSWAEITRLELTRVGPASKRKTMTLTVRDHGKSKRVKIPVSLLSPSAPEVFESLRKFQAAFGDPATLVRDVTRKEDAAAAPREGRLFRTPLLTALLFANAAVFMIMYLSGVSPWRPAVSDLLAFGASYGPFVAGGEWWRLVTALFVHAGLLHFIFNSVALSQFSGLERLFRDRDLALIYLAAGLAGNAFGLLIHPDTTAVGASGAILGLYGAFLGGVRAKSQGRKRVLKKHAASYGAALFVVVATVLNIGPHIDWAAHLGGALAGLILGYLAIRQRRIFIIAALSLSALSLMVGYL